MPNDAAFPASDTLLGSLDPKILVMASGFLHARIEDDEVMDEFEEALLVRHLKQATVEMVLNLTGFFPLQPVLLRRLDHAVTQPLDIVTGKEQLDGGEERTNEVRFLVA